MLLRWMVCPPSLSAHWLSVLLRKSKQFFDKVKDGKRNKENQDKEKPEKTVKKPQKKRPTK